MEPVSLIASLVGIIDGTVKLITYLNEVKKYSKERKEYEKEFTSLLSTLFELKHHLDVPDIEKAHYKAISKMTYVDGPLSQYETMLKEVHKKLYTGRDVRAAFTWAFMKSDLEALRLRIMGVQSTIQTALQVDHFKLSKAIQQDVEKITDTTNDIKSATTALLTYQYDKQLQNALDWISIMNYPARQEDLLSRRQPGTGKRFLESEEFAQWRIDPKGRLLCLGMPGAGKTYMVASVIRELGRTLDLKTNGVAYIFCNHKEQMEASNMNPLSSAIKQLVQNKPSTAAPLVDLYNEHKNDRTYPQPADIMKLLKTVIQSYAHVHLVIDALDEYPERKFPQLLHELLELQQSLPVRLMFSSRDIPRITTGANATSTIDIKASDEDIMAFAAEQCGQLAKGIQREPGLVERMLSGVVKAAAGIFLLARLYMARFEHCHNPNRVETILRDLPIPGEKQGQMSDLYSEAYKETMERIKHHKWSEVALSTVAWVALAKRPLTALELQHALAISDGQRDFESSCITDIEDIISSCAGLVIVEHPTNLIRFAHYTVQEYFDKHLCDHYPNAKTYVTKGCLTYLGFMRVMNDPYLRELDSYALIEYSYRNWHSHAKEAEESLTDTLLEFVSDKEIISKILEVQSMYTDSVGNWWRWGRCVRFHHGSSSLHIVAAFGLIKLAQRLQKDDQGGFEVFVNARDHEKCTPLNLAAAEGQTEMVKLLIPMVDFGVDGNGTSLIAALRNRHLETAKVLFAQPGLPINAKDSHGRHCLFYAFNEETVKLGLKCGAEADMPDAFGSTPLRYALQHRNLEVARFLSGREDISMEQHDMHGAGLLHTASSSDTSEMVGMVVESFQKRGIDLDVNDKDFKGLTPLHYAAKRVGASVCRRLLDLGADVNSRDNFGRVPMHYAASAQYGGGLDDPNRSRRRTLSLLVSIPGVMPEARCKEGRTPLAEALFSGWLGTQTWTFMVEEMHLNPLVRDKEGRPLTFLFWRFLKYCRCYEPSYEDENKLKYLLRTGIFINERDNQGKSLLAHFVEARYDGWIRMLAKYNELEWNVCHQLAITDDQTRMEAEEYLEKARHAYGPPILCLGPQLCRRCCLLNMNCEYAGWVASRRSCGHYPKGSYPRRTRTHHPFTGYKLDVWEDILTVLDYPSVFVSTTLSAIRRWNAARRIIAKDREKTEARRAMCGQPTRPRRLEIEYAPVS